MIKCPNCEGEMNFEPGVQEVVCQYCGTKFNPNELNRDVKASKEVNDLEGKSYMCTQCGARLLTFDETAITFCSYCGSQGMLEDKMMAVNKPDYIIPFKVTKEEVMKKYKAKVNANVFVPDYLKSDVVIDKFRGIYMPYSIYSFDYNGPCNNTGSKYSHHSGDYDYYNDYNIDCNVDAKFEGVSKDLRSNFYDKFSDNLVFNLNEKEVYNPNYLIGYYADVADVNPEVYVDNARDDAEKEIMQMMLDQGKFRKYGCTYPMLPMTNCKYVSAMVPFYFLAIRDQKKDRIYYAVVNGQTGEMIVDLPTSKPKYIILSLILSMIIYGLIFNYNLFNARNICLAVAIIGLISIFMIATQANKIKSMYYHEDDEGYYTVHGLPEEAKNVKTSKYLIKNVIATIVPFIIYCMDLTNDYITYISALICLLLIIFSFGDLINIHNLLVSNKLPQMEKRGGDESE